MINFQKSDVDNVANRSQGGKIIAIIYEVLKHGEFLHMLFYLILKW